VAYLTPGLNVPFWKYLSDGIKQTAAQLAADNGVTIEVTDYDSTNDPSIQLQNAQDAITRAVDVIIISPTDSATAPAVLEAAAEASIPVVIADIGTDEGDYVSFVISTNEQGAYEAGQVLMTELAAKGGQPRRADDHDLPGSPERQEPDEGHRACGRGGRRLDRPVPPERELHPGRGPGPGARPC
jgi:ABC-type sugar transport system substrate-binding protein